MARPNLDGVRLHVIITKVQDRALRQLSKETGMTVAELMRRALDTYLTQVTTPAPTRR
jgi:hypothetical protein